MVIWIANPLENAKENGGDCVTSHFEVIPRLTTGIFSAIDLEGTGTILMCLGDDGEGEYFFGTFEGWGNHGWDF